MSGSLGVAFQQIPANFLAPLFYVEFNNSLAGMVGTGPQPALLIGQTLNTMPVAPVLVPSAAYAASVFGQQSMLARMAAVYLAADPVGPLFMLPVADATGAVAATGSVTLTGTATNSGALCLYIGGQLVRVPVSLGDTATVIAGNAAAAINAGTGLMVTAVASAGAIDLTCVHKGATGNDIQLAVNLLGPAGGQTLPAGITVSITAMASGATDPDLAGVAAAIGDAPFDFIAHPYGETAQIGEITAALSDNGGRWAWDRQSYGHAFTAMRGTSSAVISALASYNDQHTTIFQNPGTPNPVWDLVADIAGTVAPSIRNIASQPLHSLALSTVWTPPGTIWNSRPTENLILAAGGATLRANSYGNVSIGEAVTTYKTNEFGQPDGSYRYVTTLYTLMAITRQLRAAIETTFGRSILVPDGTRGNPNVPFVTPKDVLSLIGAQYQIMQADGLVVNPAAMLAATVVQIDPNNPSRVNVIWRPELANGLSLLAMINQFVVNPAA